MNRFVFEQRCFLLQIYLQNKVNCTENAQKCFTIYDSVEGPTVSGIRTFTAYRETGKHGPKVSSHENIEAVVRICAVKEKFHSLENKNARKSNMVLRR